MGVSENSGTPQSSILIGFSIINHPFWGYHYFRKHPYGHLLGGSSNLHTRFGNGVTCLVKTNPKELRHDE